MWSKYISSGDFTMSDTETATETRLHFVMGDSHMAELSWVLGARSDDETRYFMCGLHVETGEATSHLVATDGRRLHVWTAPVDFIAPGEYRVIKAIKSLVILETVPDGNYQFPNWARSMPDPMSDNVTIGNRSGHNDETSTTWDLKHRDFQTRGAQFCCNLAIADPSSVINLDYLKGIGEGTWTANLYKDSKGKGQTVLFADGNRTGLVALMRNE
jgi:hypothetical protein